MSRKGPIAVSELLGRAMAAGFIKDRATLDEFEYDDVLKSIKPFIADAGEDPEVVLRGWDIIE